MAQNIDYADELHTGQHTYSKAPTVPDGSFGDAQISAAQPIDTAKLKHQYSPVYAQPNGTAAAAERKAVHVARVAGTVAGISAGIVTPAVGAATVTVDLKKNGTTVLTAVVSISSAQAAYALVAGAIASAAYAANDVFELVVTATAGGGTLPQGLFVTVTLREGPG